MTTELTAPNAAHGEAIEPGAIRFVRLLPLFDVARDAQVQL